MKQREIERKVWSPGHFVQEDGSASKPRFEVLGDEFTRYEAAQRAFAVIFNAMRKPRRDSW